jgi:Zn-dependent M28 family amino/carboxypeptidase
VEKKIPFCIALLLSMCCAFALHSSKHPEPSSWQVKPQWVHADEDFLASDAMRGRGTLTHDELVAATYIGSQLESFGVKPAAPDGSYVEVVEVPASALQRKANANSEPKPQANSNEPNAGAPSATQPPSSASESAGAAPAESTAETPLHTYNAVGILHGSGPHADEQAILLTAHLDHLGIGKPVNGDDIYNGADDDASGVTAVLELARALASGPPLKRTVIFACFGAEETGKAFGARYFLAHPPVPLTAIIANLEFEMIGRADPKVKPDELWLTGWERSNLGPELAKHGARLVADPHPEQHFFRRSDNIALARQGVVAQTVSSFGLHPQYHKPDDDIAHLDFDHLTDSIQSMIEPVRWLANSDFKPEWNAGGKP